MIRGKFVGFHRYGSRDEVWIPVDQVQEVYGGGGGSTIRHRSGSAQVAENIDAVLATLAEASERLERYRAAAAREGWRS